MKRDRKPDGEAPSNPRPGPAPNVTIWGWDPYPLALREHVKVKMPKSREKVNQNQAGAKVSLPLLSGKKKMARKIPLVILPCLTRLWGKKKWEAVGSIW